MIIQKSKFPGSHERHLLRCENNPLFEQQQIELDDDNLLNAQKQDHEEIEQFNRDFNKALQETIQLTASVESDVILELKDRLERLYNQATRIGDQQDDLKVALQKLLALIMSAVRQGAGNDSQAHQELDQEDQARTAHFTLLESALVADLLMPESVIKPQQLIPSLLSSSKDDLALVVQLFDQIQLSNIVEEADNLLRRLITAGHEMSDAMENYAFIQGYIEYLSQNYPDHSRV
jgi:chaperonin cofactor prefoldin